MVDKKPPTVGGLILCAMIPILPTTQAYGLIAVLYLGFLDDVLVLRPFVKLLVEAVIAYSVTGNLVAAAWVVFFMNAMNLSDNMDGLAIGLGIISSAAMGMWPLTILLLAILPLNFPGAKIYLGDLGSLSLGYLLALSVLENTTNMVGVAVPLADTLYVAISRPLRGRSIFRGGRDHLSHLIAMRTGKTWAVLALWLTQVMFILLGFLIWPLLAR